MQMRGETVVVAQAIKCITCDSFDTSPWKQRGIERPLEPEDLQITDHRYGVTLSLRKCQRCGFIFAEGDEIAELTSLYERLEDSAYEQSQDSRALQMAWLLDRALRRRPDTATMLDIGAGLGLLVAEGRRRGLHATGIEPSRSLVERAAKVTRTDLIQGVFPHAALQGRRFDLIFLIDVIEHVADPVALLRDCGAALRPQGLLVVVTPDVGSVAARLLGQRWWHFRLAHVGYFDRRSLAEAVQISGLEIERIARAKWFFRAHYLAQRVEEYLPVRWINRLVQRTPLVRRLHDLIIPLNLHDSLLVFVRHPGDRVHS
jgi:2-polyprenyl-3-methyl-5-hydroxy-6-metoxy-1,4-benzoquinol methylase